MRIAYAKIAYYEVPIDGNYISNPVVISYSNRVKKIELDLYEAGAVSMLASK